MSKLVYFFGAGRADGSGSMKELLGGKGAGLAEMTHLGIPVPAGFTITTEVCTQYEQSGEKFPTGLEAEIKSGLSKIEEVMGAKFGSRENPLLLSVRSGARASMPGMMDTILNLGLNDETVQALAAKNPRFAYDSYRRFIQMYSDVVLGLDSAPFEKMIDEKKERKGVRQDTDLDAADLEELSRSFLVFVKKQGVEFPKDPWKQLWGAIGAVLKSWNTRRAMEYRRINNIPAHWGTAANVQAMVFGNMGNDCATGVAFTRDPNTGENKFFGEYLINAQGEDVVAGIRTPQPMNRSSGNSHSLEMMMPQAYQELLAIREKLERHYKDMQDIEFTIQKGKVWMLQTRSGKRAAAAAVRVAAEMMREGLIDEKTAVLRVNPAQLEQLLHPTLDPSVAVEVLAKGLPASPGAAVGRAIFTADEALEWAERGEQVILVRMETSPEDIHGMHVAQGVLTARGGMTSHAAVVARGMGKCCVSGCSEINLGAT